MRVSGPYSVVHTPRMLTLSPLVLYREVMGTRIPGGSEDVLLDLAVRQLVKIYKTQTKMLEAAAGSKL